MKYVTVNGVKLEHMPRLNRAVKAVLVDPLANFLVPRSVIRWMVKRSGSELLNHTLAAPGGWRSMVVAYEDRPPTGYVDRIVCNYGILPMGLRNRRRLVGHMLGRMLGATSGRVNIVSIGAGVGSNILEPISRAENPQIYAYCIDLAHEAFEHGRRACEKYGICERVTYIQGDANHVERLIDVRPDIVTLLGLIEYLSDEQVTRILNSMYKAMDAGGQVLVNSLASAGGVERFLRTVFDLHLSYRSEGRVRELLSQCGFRVERAEREPTGIYSMIQASKPPAE